MNAPAETGCCPRFDPEPWDEKEVQWQDKLFVKDRVRSFLHIPLNFGKVMVRNMQAIGAADAHEPEHLMLSDENSLWGADVYIAVSKEVPGARMERISGKFFTKVFEGPYSQTRNWCKQMQELAQQQNRQLHKTYYWYTTCPKCAKAYGKNYVVLVGQES